MIVEEAGFKGSWASGLTLSTSLGVRDNTEASLTQILDIVVFMNDHVSSPINQYHSFPKKPLFSKIY